MKIRSLAVVTALALLMLAGCGTRVAGNTSDPLVGYSDTSEGVAATVNGEAIGERNVTAYIESFRKAQGLESEEEWGQWLYDNGYGPDDVRSDTIDYFVNQALMEQGARELDVSIDEDAVDQRIELARAQYESDAERESYLENAGITEAGARWQVEMQFLQEALEEAIAAESAVDRNESELLESVQEYASKYAGAKRSSQILFNSSDREVANDVLSRLVAGNVDFSEAVSEYSIDAASASQGGDVGWDCFQTFVEPYQAALTQLAKGEVSGLVESDYGIHVIQCTDVLELPDGGVTSLDDVSPGFTEAVREKVDLAAKQTGFTQWMNERKNTADIQRNPIPDGVSYYVDLTPFVSEGENATQASQEESKVG